MASPRPKKMYTAALLLLIGYCIAIASGQSNGEVRLAVDGLASRSITAGRVQVYLQGQWSNICNEEFGIEEANVVCHQLGYDRALEYSTASRDRFGIDDHPTLMTNVKCGNNNFLHILQCTYSITMNCSDSNDVSVTCSTTPIWNNTYIGLVRLQEGIYPSQGQLEIYRSNSWSIICKDGYATNEFGQEEADTACRQLGYTHASQFNHLNFTSGSGRTTNLYACCIESRSCLNYCRCTIRDSSRTRANDLANLLKKRATRTTCSPTDDVTVQCDFDPSRKSDAGQRRSECNLVASTDSGLSAEAIGGITFGITFAVLLPVFIVIFIYFKRND